MEGEGGVIYVSGTDPYSILTKGYVGVYILSSRTGMHKYHTTLFNSTTLEKPLWATSGTTLDRLLECPLVSQVTLRSLTKVPMAFRVKICSLDVRTHPNADIHAFVGASSSCAGDELINEVISSVGDKLFSPPMSISTSPKDNPEMERLSRDVFTGFMSRLSDYLWKHPMIPSVQCLTQFKSDLKAAITAETPPYFNVSPYFSDLPPGMKLPLIVTTDGAKDGHDFYINNPSQLTELSRNELVNMATALNSCDQRYDDLRQRIANQLITRQK